MDLIFVYNADSDLFSSLTDFTHKILSPETYQCSLCALTYGNFQMKKEWKNFIEKLPGKKEFLHKDNFRKEYKLMKNIKLPAIFYKSKDSPELLVSSDELNQLQDLNELISILSNKISSMDKT